MDIYSYLSPVFWAFLTVNWKTQFSSQLSSSLKASPDGPKFIRINIWATIWWATIWHTGTKQEPMSRSIQLPYIPVSAFLQTDLCLNRIFLEWDSRGSAMTNHKKLIDVTLSLDRNCLSFTKEVILKINQSVKMPWLRLSVRVACSYSSAPARSIYRKVSSVHRR